MPRGSWHPRDIPKPPSVVLHAVEVSSVFLVSFTRRPVLKIFRSPRPSCTPWRFRAYIWSHFMRGLMASSGYSEAPIRRLARRGGVKRISGLIYKNLLRLWKESDLRGLLSSLKEIRGVLKTFQRPVCRLTRRGGVECISGLIYETRGVLKIFLEARSTIPIFSPNVKSERSQVEMRI
ncbi:hypothetical protein PAXINDRAFT_11075 [Paxillus involutus ATCC 200175]|nr:hypothetical protein PAXINDRAFT_11075 [Paxillus involutus ATCC 200175]